MQNELEVIFKQFAKSAGSEFKSLKISKNRYDKIVIEIAYISALTLADHKAETELINREISQTLIDIIAENKLAVVLGDVLLKTSLLIVEEVEQMEYIRTFYPGELTFDMPLPDYKIRLLAKGISVSAVFEKNTVKTTPVKSVSTSLNTKR